MADSDEPTELVWFATGSSSGLGREIVRRAAEAGDRVVATARRPEALADLVAAHPALVTSAALDVTDPEQIREAVDSALRQFGRIDVLVNNAGYGLRGAVEAWEMEQLRRLFETNFFGAVEVTRAVLPSMRAAGRGWIVQMSSVAGFRSGLGSSAYSASKFALEGLSEGLGREVHPFGIDVTLVEPGPFRTDFSGRSHDWAEHPAYVEVFAEEFEAYQARSGRQPNDPARAADILVSLAHGNRQQRPWRLPLGPEAFDIARRTFDRRRRELDEVEALGRDTAFDDDSPV
ncbi:SDR family NAD(P)-dependent oxidoreductase [Brevibacterium daeguense]|nr:SDR family NAD(P)-dependent oxidoreductase [Brevibacterium daeguense]